jgi:hypothetical protein
MAIDDGGAAFPSNCDPHCSVPRGMSLRAHIATHIHAQLCCDANRTTRTPSVAARLAVQHADALIAALKE